MAKGYWVSVYPAISDPERLTAYNKLARPAVQAGGGRVLSLLPSRGGRVVAHEAGITQRVVLIEFDSFEQAVAAYEIRLSLVGSEMCIRDRSHARSSAASAGGADSAKAAPAVVNTTLRVLRTSRLVPSSASNRRIRALSAGCAIPIRAAARVKFNSCASTRKYRRLTVSGATCPPGRLITIRSESIPSRSFPRPHIKP